MSQCFQLGTVFVALAAAALPVSASAQSTNVAPAPVARVLACKSLVDSTARLACFDRETATLASAHASGDVIMMDRRQAQKTKRSLFGIALPDLGVFGDSDDPGSRLETKIETARQGADGKWILGLAEGGRWAQIDSRQLVVDPKPGHPILIRRAAMGSYLANVNKQIAIRVRRIQ